MEELDYWRFCTELPVIQAVLLILGIDPGLGLNGNDLTDVGKFSEQDRPTGFTAIFTALQHDINSNRLKARKKYRIREEGLYGLAERYEDDEIQVRSVHPDERYRIDDGDPLYTDSGQGFAMKKEPDWNHTTIMVEDLKGWLRDRGVTTGFFFPNETKGDTPGYLDPDNQYYAPKLAAAVHAWLTVTSDHKQYVKSKTPKQAIMKWLNENAARYGLSNDDGTPNKTGIEEVSKISNWQPQGGVAKTPGS